jgi:hypothetical protein
VFDEDDVGSTLRLRHVTRLLLLLLLLLPSGIRHLGVGIHCFGSGADPTEQAFDQLGHLVFIHCQAACAAHD